MGQRQQPDWGGIALVSTDVGSSKKKQAELLVVGGVQYATEGEALLAGLLRKLGIPFTPNVKITLTAPDEEIEITRLRCRRGSLKDAIRQLQTERRLRPNGNRRQRKVDRKERLQGRDGQSRPNARRRVRPVSEVIYVPDFIFNQCAYLWRNEDGSEEAIHGIEAKGCRPGKPPLKAVWKLGLLLKQRGINVKLLSNQEIREFAEKGSLPMKPLK